MDKPKVAVLSGFGINCETETITAFEMAGAMAKKPMSTAWLTGISNYQTLILLRFLEASHSEIIWEAVDS